jgi:hypothetical protein
MIVASWGPKTAVAASYGFAFRISDENFFVVLGCESMSQFLSMKQRRSCFISL